MRDAMPIRLGRDLSRIIAPLSNDPLLPHGSGFGLDATHFDSVLRTEGNGYNLFEIYQEIERDCHAFAVLQSRKLDVARREWEIKPWQQRNASIRRKDQKTADMVADMLKAIGSSGADEIDGKALIQSGESGFDTWAYAALNALLYGFSGSEIIWSGGKERYPERLVYRKPHRFRFELIPEGYLPLLKVRASLDIPLPPRKFIFHYHQPENGPFGLGLGHRLFWPVWFKREDVKQWLLFSEKYASPTIAVMHPNNATAVEIGEALETAEAMSSQVAIAVPEDFRYELLEAQRSGSINAYKDLVSWCDEQISKAVLGQTGTTDQSSGGGSRARDEVAERVSIRLSKHDADCLANTLNATLIKWIIQANGGDSRSLPQIWWQYPELEQREDLTARVAIDKTLWDMEFIPTREYIEETYEIELEEEPEEEVGPDGQPIPSASSQLEQMFGGGVIPTEQPAQEDEPLALSEPEDILSAIFLPPVDFKGSRQKLKKLKAKKCTKGRACGGSCISKTKTCRVTPPPGALAAGRALAEIGNMSEGDALARIAQLEAELSRLKQPTEPQPGDVLKQNLADLKFDPERFQYKLLPGETGATGSLSGVGKWDDNLAGVIQVWRDPADGNTYIVNGHNRATLANRLGVESVTVRYLDAANASEARSIGALTNIAEGRGNAMDAAKFFRDTGISRADLEARGIPMRERIATDGIALSNLDDSLFRQVIDGRLPESRATIIGSSGLEGVEQRALVDLINSKEKSGRRLTNETVRELTDVVKSSVTQTQTQFDLFGASEVQKNLAIEKAQLQSNIRQRLGREKRLFGTVAKSTAAEELARAGNQIDVNRSGEIASTAGATLAVFDQLKNMSGPISKRINDATEAIAEGANRKVVERQLYEDIVNLISGGNY